MLLGFRVDCVGFLRGAIDVITMLSGASQVWGVIVKRGQTVIVI